MAQITLTAGSPPAFLSKNYVNRDSKNNSGLTVTSNDSIKDRLYDMTHASLYASAGSSDGNEQIITCIFYEGSSVASRPFDFIALLNNNYKNFIVEYKETEVSEWATVHASLDFTESDNSNTDLVISLASTITATSVRIRCNNTIDADEEKQLGVFIVALGTFQTANSMSKFIPKPTENVKALKMLDGTYDESAIYRDTASFTMYSWAVMWRFVGDSERNNFNVVRTGIDPFLFYPEPGEQVEEIYLSRMKRGTFKEPYSITNKGAGRNISFTAFEVGGA